MNWNEIRRQRCLNIDPVDYIAFPGRSSLLHLTPLDSTCVSSPYPLLSPACFLDPYLATCSTCWAHVAPMFLNMELFHQDVPPSIACRNTGNHYVLKPFQRHISCHMLNSKLLSDPSKFPSNIGFPISRPRFQRSEKAPPQTSKRPQHALAIANHCMFGDVTQGFSLTFCEEILGCWLSFFAVCGRCWCSGSPFLKSAFISQSCTLGLGGLHEGVG